MTILTVKANDQNLIVANNTLLASGDKGSVILHVDFSREWDGYAKTAVFYQNADNVYHAVLDSNGECVIPWEVLQNEGLLFFGIFGAKNDTRKTSEVVKYRIRKGAWSEETAVHDPTPDIYTQVLSTIAAHAENKNNPHGVTAEQVGAAPAGYGLGTGSPMTISGVSALDSTTDNGWYWVRDISGHSFGGVTCDFALLFVIGIDAYHVTQYLYPVGYDTVVQRELENKNKWGDWCCENPPMIPGAVYRTTRRHNGKVVYAKLLDTQSVSSGNTNIYYGENVSELVDITVKISGTVSRDIILPYIYGDMASGYTATCAPCSDSVLICCGANISGTAYVTIWFTVD